MSMRARNWLCIVGVIGLMLVGGLPAFSLHPLEMRWFQPQGLGVIQASKVELVVISTRAVVGRINAGSPILDISVSPDGSKIAYATSAHGLFVSNIDGSGAVRLDKGECANIQWTSDGQWVIYVHRKLAGASSTEVQITFYAIKIDGAARTQLYTAPFNPSQLF